MFEQMLSLSGSKNAEVSGSGPLRGPRAVLVESAQREEASGDQRGERDEQAEAGDRKSVV